MSYLVFQKQAAGIGPVERYKNPASLRRAFARPGFLANEDILLMLGPGGEILGSITMRREYFLRRVVLSLLMVHWPADENSPGKLVEEGMRIAATRAMLVAHVNVSENEVKGIGLLERLGFGLARRYLELEMPPAALEIVSGQIPGEKHRCMRAGEEEKLARLQNAAFKDTWGYNANTAVDIKYSVETSGGPQNVVVIEENGDLVAYCWIMPGLEGEIAEPDAGRIYMIGVHPAQRGRGLGRYALMAGLRMLKAKDKVRAVLTVDSENRTALALYESLGFRVTAASLWYERTLKAT